MVGLYGKSKFVRIHTIEPRYLLIKISRNRLSRYFGIKLLVWNGQNKYRYRAHHTDPHSWITPLQHLILHILEFNRFTFWWVVYTRINLAPFNLENLEVLFLKRDGLDITRARPLFKWNDEGIARVISRTNNGHVRGYIGPYKPPRFKNNTFIIILKHFQK